MESEIPKWDADPQAAFDDFVKTKAFVDTGHLSGKRSTVPDTISASTRQVYRHMFTNFSTWLAKENGKRFSALSRTDIEAFVKFCSRDVDSTALQRYLRLLSRCYTHLSLYPNPAEQAIRVVEKNSDSAMAYLSDDQVAKFIAALPVHTPVKTYREAKDSSWKRPRDRALQLMMLCAGVKVSEAIGMLISEIQRQPEVDGTLRITFASGGKHETLYPHATHLRKEAVGEVMAWLDQRMDLRRTKNMQGELLFPSNVDGKALSKVQVYKQTAATFERAGIGIEKRKGGRTLRNTYAIQDLVNGVDRDKIVAKLGLANEDSLAPYDEVLKKIT